MCIRDSLYGDVSEAVRFTEKLEGIK